MHWQRNVDRSRATILGLVVLVWAGASWAQPRGAGIRVLSPPDGAVFEPGQAVTVIVEPTGPIPPEVVSVVTRGVITGSFSAPFHVTFAAQQALGRYKLGITAKDARGHVLDAELTYHVETATPVTSIQVRSNAIGRSASVDLIAGVLNEQIRVLGTFADGKSLNISRSREVQYVSSDPQVATVSPDGLVEAVDPGTTTITVSYKDKSVTVPVTVKFKKLTVPLDIEPGKRRNRINLDSRGHVRVAVLSTSAFAASTVDPPTVKFGPAGASPDLDHVQTKDVNGDGRPDLVLRFRIRDTGLQCGQSTATLTGRTVLGDRISGTGTIHVVGKACGRDRDRDRDGDDDADSEDRDRH